MFPWNIAKSAAGTMFARFAIKRLCKFFLKKKLGQFLLGDIDLDQLDVQLRAGTIQLSDLALNVDYFNLKLDKRAAVRVKEGSIGSLLVKMPWNSKGCVIEVDTLEIVIAPWDNDRYQVEAGTCNSTDCVDELQKPGTETAYETANSSFVDVHEGVKAVAKMVKWLLTSFHVKIKNLIFALDPYLEKNEDISVCHKTLVVRITEVECGTCVGEDANLVGEVKIEDALGMSHLTNFLKFQGAKVELLLMNNVDNISRVPVLTGVGDGDGVSGNVKLSIPWKNGALNIHKVDAEVCVDQVKVKLHLGLMKWLILLWETFKNSEKNNRSGYNCCETAESLNLELTCPGFPPDENSGRLPTKDSVTDIFLQDLPLISDWVPYPIDKCQKGGIKEADLGASVDQFFECFDGMRSSQSLFGSSGMWNWTCSVFDAITAASNIASGSVHTPAEQQHAETNLRVSLVGVSIALSFLDEDQMIMDGAIESQNVDSGVHYLESTWQHIVINVQVYSKEWKLEAIVDHIDLDDCFSSGDDAVDSEKHEQSSKTTQSLAIRHLQERVQSTLPSRSMSPAGSGLEIPNAFAKLRSHRLPVESGISRISVEQKDVHVVRVNLLNTSGLCYFRFSASSGSSDGHFLGQTSVSLKLPPFIFWLNFALVDMVSDVFKKIGSSFGISNTTDESAYETSEMKCGNTLHGAENSSSCPHLTNTLWLESLKGDIFLPDARIMLSFPFKNGGGFSTYNSWDQFIALDFSLPPKSNKKKAEGTTVVHESAPGKDYTSSITHKLHLNISHADIYLITVASKSDGDGSSDLKKQRFSAQKIMSLSSRNNYFSVVSILWHDTAVTGAWIIRSAKHLANADGLGSKNSSMKQGFEFASVNKRKATGNLSSEVQRKMILSSKVSLHFFLSAAIVTLDRSQYTILVHLLKQVVDELSTVGCDSACASKEREAIQTSIFVESNHVKIVLELDTEDNSNSSLQRELPGLWHCMKLEGENFELLSVSNIGGICGANFLWMTHGEAKLLGSIRELPDQEFLLILCCNSSMGRGDGEGSNALSCSTAGSSIVHLWDPESFHDFMSITVKCGTIIAPGGRLDWLEKVCSFFSLPSHETSEAADIVVVMGDPLNSLPVSSSFTLDLVDVGFSYEPYVKKLVINLDCPGVKPGNSAHVEGKKGDDYVACVLAASWLKLSSTKTTGVVDNEYNIRGQDLGVLLHSVSILESFSGNYGAENLRKVGYVKVAEEAHLEMVLRINSEDQFWELNCYESHIVLRTCHDTTAGLVRLATQIQELFAPDVEESTVHLQSRWNNNKQVEGNNYFGGESKSGEPFSSSSMGKQGTPAAQSMPKSNSLMSEICEDAFTNWGRDVEPNHQSWTKFWNLLDLVEEGSESAERCPGNFMQVPGGLVGLEGEEASAVEKSELMEGYYLSELRSLSELTVSNHFSNEISISKLLSLRSSSVEEGNDGWFTDASLKIRENHISDAIESADSKLEKFKGRLLLNNMHVSWHMYAGSDWHGLEKDVEHAGDGCVRGKTLCLELALSDMHVQYDIFPDGSMCVSKLCLSVKDLYLFDKSTCAPWDMVLRDYNSKEHPRGSSSKALKLDLEAVRPDPSTPLEEYRLRVAFLPLSLYLHQSQLDFLIAFFGKRLSSVDALASSDVSSLSNKDLKGDTTTEEALLPFFQKFDVWPVIVRVEYHPSRVDLAALSGGRYVELVNLVPWKGVELELKHVQAAGVYGWSNVCETILGEWLEDISQNQIHKLLHGLPPFQSLVSVGSGAAKLVSFPVKSYRKDHRLVKGLQRGTIAFLKSISVEALGLGVHLAAGAHDILLHAECMLTHIQPSMTRQVGRAMKRNIRSDQPKDTQHGLRQAYESLTDGFGKTASALLHSPMKTYQRGGGASSALVTAVKGAPAAAIAPASAAAQALHCALLGVKNSLDPGQKEDTMNKYLGPSTS